MDRSYWKSRLVSSIILLATTSALYAQQTEVAVPSADSKPATDLPSGKEVLAKHVAATGGAEKIKSIRSMKSTGEFKMPDAGLAAPMTIFMQQPNNALVIIEFPGMGKIRKGTSGDVAWEVSDIQGARIIDGKERADFFREIDLLAEVHPEKYFESIECVGTSEVDGKTCLKIELTPKSGGTETRYYDADTFLLVNQQQIQETAMGPLNVSSTLSDYRDVGGLKIPHAVSIKMLGQNQQVITKSVAINPEIPAGTFDLPDEIKQLQSAEKEASSEKE